MNEEEKSVMYEKIEELIKLSSLSKEMLAQKIFRYVDDLFEDQKIACTAEKEEAKEEWATEKDDLESQIEDLKQDARDLEENIEESAKSIRAKIIEIDHLKEDRIKLDQIIDNEHAIAAYFLQAIRRLEPNAPAFIKDLMSDRGHSF
jgi:septal ring factor EnvC (AmiA/AmiB activator)